MSANPSWPSPPLSGIPVAAAEPPLSPVLSAPVEPASASEPQAPAAQPAFEPAPAPPAPDPVPFPAAPAPPDPVHFPTAPAPLAEQPSFAAVPSFHVLIRLDGGETVEVSAHGDETAARAEATALMRYLRDGRGDWPFVSGRFIRPERIVSIDVDRR